MPFPRCKTKIVCTVGPASNTPEMLEGMILAGMNVARLNFSHASFAEHGAMIDRLWAASEATGRRLAIMADLPGPKIRIGRLAEEPVELERGKPFTLGAGDFVGDARRVSTSFADLPRVVGPGDQIFLKDGTINLQVERVEGAEVHCRIKVGGAIRSRIGINLPGIDLGLSAFTEHDQDCLEFALSKGVDAVSQSFVERAEDILALREAADRLGADPFVIAKIERLGALDHVDEILTAADGIMIARGDLGVEIPIERIAIVQKDLVRRANRAGKPVITATQMLESMIVHSRPTRAEVTDVANAVLDGSDCVMLSGESATGRFPLEAVSTLVKIAAATEDELVPHEEQPPEWDESGESSPAELIALSAEAAVMRSATATVIIPTVSGATARNLARFRLPTWITAVSSREATCRELQFSYGVHTVRESAHPEDWNAYARDFLRELGIDGGLVLLAEGPSPDNPDRNHRLELIELEPDPGF